MSKYGEEYGEVARLAAKKAREGMAPLQAWKKSAEKIFHDRPPSRNKDCPRCAFLGLAKDGLIVKVDPGNYTKSEDNKRYAIAGVALLRKEPNLCDDVNEMWRRIMCNEPDKDKKHNNQMDVVAALWKNYDIKHSA